MAEYIEREAAVAAMNAEGYTKNMRVHKAILEIPAADVRPVVRGKWFIDADYEYINCSVCLYPIYMGFESSSDARKYISEENIGRFRYCPHCGADMRGD